MSMAPGFIKPFGAKPSNFNGTRDDQEVLFWLSQIDTYIEQQTGGLPITVPERPKILSAITFLDKSPRRAYNTKVKRDGEFLTYDAFKEWMTTFYATPDVANSARVKFENCKQNPDK